MNAIDTNIWVYCHDARDATKQRRAQHLVERLDSIALPWQVGCEFIAAARKLQSFGFSENDAWQSLDDMQAIAEIVLLPVPEIWPQSRTIQQQQGVHFWDAILIATCAHYHVEILYSEDIPANSACSGLQIVNPLVQASLD